MVAVGPTQSGILTVLRSFLLSILPGGTEVIQSQVNRVPEPKGEDFVLMTPILLNRLSTNVDTFDADASAMSILQPTMVTVQLDVHGPNSADNAQVITTLFRDLFGVDFFASLTADIVPLYTDDPRQMAFINEQQQYENRWVVSAVMQANQSIGGIPQDSADELKVTTIEVEAAYPAF